MTTPYRNVREALAHREAELTRDLEALERARTELSDVAARIEETRAARDQTRASLARLATATAERRSLETLRIASPCTARWDEMRGDEQMRYCGQCRKKVYNLSAMTRDEAE